MTSPALHELMHSVSTSEDLAAFVVALQADFAARPNEWQNVELPSALEAIAAWLRDMERAKNKGGESLGMLNPFQFCAQVLHAAKVYE